MNLAWEREVWKAQRAAEVLFELPKCNWLGAVHTQEQMDPSKAMESLFSQFLGNRPD